MSLADIPFVGEAAGLGTAVCWSLCSLAFAFAGKRVGVFAVNQLRLPIAVLLLGTSHLIMLGELWPGDATPRQVFWLALSGLLGLSLGDLCLFRCFVLVGPRLGHILLTTWPVMAAALAWPILGEGLPGWALAGIAVTTAGVATVLADRSGKDEWQPPAGLKAPRAKGLVMGLLGASGQAVGYVTAKLGMLSSGAAESIAGAGIDASAETLDPLSATLIRMIAGALGIWVIAAGRGHIGNTVRAAGDRRALLYIAVGAAFGPFLGVWLSLISAAHTKLGISATLMATAPILMLPLARIAYGDRPGRPAVVGTFIAVVGVALLFLAKGH
jgi:drug/metabolite transporter (DMT)-like permease